MVSFTRALLFVGLFLFCACSHQQEIDEGHGGRQLYVVSWNVQTFFDAETSGLEYSDFRGSKSRWSQRLYEARLDRLVDAIEQLDADILVLQEIENIGVMYDISNRLAGKLRGKDAYGWMCFEGEEESAIGCGVFSRLPLGQKRVHQVDCRTLGEQPQLRPLLEVEVLVEDGDKTEGSAKGENSSVLNLFVCHWKSKSGGEEEAAFWQEKQEALLGYQLQRVLKNSSDRGKILICGDFNRDLHEFDGVDEQKGTVLLDSVEVKSGWLYPKVTSGGSYWYQEQWEKIDHVFTAGSLDIGNFEALAKGAWVHLDEAGNVIPFRYTMWNDTGYSDHLPVGCWINF